MNLPFLRLIVSVFALGLPLLLQSAPVSIVERGEARLPIISGSVEEPVADLRENLQRATGVELELREGNRVSGPGIYVGLLSDFENLPSGLPTSLEPEEFVLLTKEGSLFLLGGQEFGVRHAVSQLLRELGFRWFFPGDNWTIIPELETVSGEWDIRRNPDFNTRRQFSFGFGAYPQTRREFDIWARFNGLGGPFPISTGHTWYGLNRERDFETNPEWFALVERDGEMVRRASKPCFSHPEVIEKFIQHVRNAGERGSRSVSMSPPDGLGYCECELCQSVFQGAEPHRAHGSMFATREDGTLVNITSETLFNAINIAARVAAEEFPDLLVATNAYSAYSHPPSFPMEPNVFVNTTTAFRRTPLSMEEQLVAWGEKVGPGKLGIRDYWSVYQWDWDNPNINQNMKPFTIQERLQLYHRNNTSALLTEMSNNWGARGPSYYLGVKLLWDIHADLPAAIADFYQTAFGPAAPVMERYYARWIGPEMIVLDPANHELIPEQGTWGAGRDRLADSRVTLRDAFADLQEAASMTDDPAILTRIHDLMMYQYYLYLRLLNWEASNARDAEAAINTARDETRFASTLPYTNMIHTRAFLGKAYHRRFRGFTWETIENLEEFQEREPLRRELQDPMPWSDFQPLWQKAYEALQASTNAE